MYSSTSVVMLYRIGWQTLARISRSDLSGFFEPRAGQPRRRRSYARTDRSSSRPAVLAARAVPRARAEVLGSDADPARCPSARRRGRRDRRAGPRARRWVVPRRRTRTAEEQAARGGDRRDGIGHAWSLAAAPASWETLLMQRLLRWRTPFEAVCSAWDPESPIFKVNPHHLIAGRHM